MKVIITLRKFNNSDAPALKSTLVMEDLYSCEYYENLQNSVLPYQQVLKSIDFNANTGELWSIFGSSVFEIKLLLEIMANAKAFEKGKLLIGGFDPSRKKRTILPYVFYIGSTNMAFGNMNVLEYLMFITSHSKRNAISRQEYLLDYLVEAKLGYICLTPISLLTPQEKSIVILAAAMLSDSILLIMNLPRLQYDHKQITSIGKLTSKLPYSGKTLIFNTECYELAQSISTHISYIYKGAIVYKDSLNNFINEYDRVIYVLGVDNIDYMVQTLKFTLPQFEYRIVDETIQVLDIAGDKQSGVLLFEALSTINLKPTFVRENKKNIKNAIQGLMKQNDIQ